MEIGTTLITLKEYDYMRDFVKEIKSGKTYIKRTCASTTEIFLKDEKVYEGMVEEINSCEIEKKSLKHAKEECEYKLKQLEALHKATCIQRDCFKEEKNCLENEINKIKNMRFFNVLKWFNK